MREEYRSKVVSHTSIEYPIAEHIKGTNADSRRYLDRQENLRQAIIEMRWYDSNCSPRKAQ